MNTWSADAKKAMLDNPDYFIWWYTVKSVGLGVAAAVAAYYLGKDKGRSAGTFGGLLSGGLPARGPIPAKQVARVMKKLQAKVERCGVTQAQLHEGMAVEREHRDVTKLGVEKTARIALAHLCERKDYYKRLKKYVEP